MLLSIVLILRNASDVLNDSLASVQGLWDELIAVDNQSTDDGAAIIEKYGGKVYQSSETNLGKLKQFIVNKAKGDWVLVLDSDERVTPALYRDIKSILKNPPPKINGYQIPYQNYFLGKTLHHGGENYFKLILFRRSKGWVTPKMVHEEVLVDGPTEKLTHFMIHYSYRSVPQILVKFTGYAKRAVIQKYRDGEKITLKKLFLYGPHMFWARYIKDKGYKDGIAGMILALSFAYMEQLTYILLCFAPVWLR